MSCSVVPPGGSVVFMFGLTEPFDGEYNKMVPEQDGDSRGFLKAKTVSTRALFQGYNIIIEIPGNKALLKFQNSEKNKVWGLTQEISVPSFKRIH